MADHLAIPDGEREKFVRMARGEFVPVMASPLDVEAIPALNFPSIDKQSASQEVDEFYQREKDMGCDGPDRATTLFQERY